MKTSSILLSGASLASLFMLSGCFGGDDVNGSPGTPAVTAQVPASASATVTDFIAYLQQLVVASADTLEPVSVANVTPPTSDTTEPTALN